MDSKPFIRLLFSPLQPAAINTTEKITYTEFLPALELQPYIYCYWQFKTNEPLTTGMNHLIASDGCIDIFFDLHNPKDNYVMGFYKKFTEFKFDKIFNFVGIRFLPTMFPQFFRINAIELSNRFEHLMVVVPYLSEFIKNRFNENQQEEDFKHLLDNYFFDLIANKTFNNDNRLYGAIEIILKNCGVVDIEKDLNTGISNRQLHRLFEYYIGDSAKTFSKVVRFQNVLNSKPSRQSLRQNKLFYDAGYYDQSHFIKEFKNFYGVTPKKAFLI